MNEYKNMNMIDIIIYYLNIVNSDKNINDSLSIHKRSAKYLLGQTVRQLNLPREKYYLSVKAREKWNLIRDDSIFNNWYRNTVEKNVPIEIDISLYKGTSKTPNEVRKINVKDKFIFKDVFHDDHIIPINLILKKLLKLESPNYESVVEILNDISVCRMLKSEDRMISERSKRPYNEKEIIEKLYKEKYNITLIGYDYFDTK